MRRLGLDEKLAFETCTTLVKELINNEQNYRIDSKSLISLSKLYHMLLNFPKRVFEGTILLSVSKKNDIGEVNYSELEVGCDCFLLLDGGTVYTSGVGFDSYIGFFYTSDCDETDLDFKEQLFNWKSNFLSLISMDRPNLVVDDDAAIAEGYEEDSISEDLEE